ncbi:MAG: histidine phosphatase family protein [Ruminococcaceae bacterium]|nr:histidine phosphatase family protein [Oscillospiraceae bacterium]
MDLYIIRHGDPDYDNDTLTEYGWKQAEALGKRLLKEGIDYIYSSPLGRAKDTAKPLADILGKNILIQPWAQEIGPLYIPNPEFLSDECIDKGFRWYEAERFKGMPYAQIEERIHAGIDSILGSHGYERKNDKYIPHIPSNIKIALFCHGNMSPILFAHLFNVPVNKIMAQAVMYTTGITAFHFNNEEATLPVCTMFNERSHLKKHPDPNVDKIPQV